MGMRFSIKVTSPIKKTACLALTRLWAPPRALHKLDVEHRALIPAVR